MKRKYEFIRQVLYAPETCTCSECHKDIKVPHNRVQIDVDYLMRDDDEEGYYWRAFCPECYDKLKDSTDLETLYKTHESCCLSAEDEED